MSAIDPQDYGMLVAKVEGMGREIGEMKAQQTRYQADITKKVDTIITQLAEARGGGRVMLWLMGGGGASLGAIAMWLASHFGGGSRPS